MNSLKKYVGKFVSVETDEWIYTGTLRANGDGTFSVMSGLRGRPPVLYADQIVSVESAEDLVSA